jgi:hypothetical protein
MQTDWKFYRDWFDWAVEKAEALARAGGFLNLALFVRELLQVVWLLVGLLESLRALFKGNLAALARLFVVFREPTVLRQPAERTFNNPTMRQDYKPLNIVRPFEDLQHPAGESGAPRHQLPGIAAVRPDQPQARKRPAQLLQHQLGTVPVLDPGAVDDHRQDHSQRVYHDVALAPFDILAFVVAVDPPFWGVFTDWLSMIAADGVGSRPSCSRTFTRKASCTASITPASRQRRKWSQTSA